MNYACADGLIQLREFQQLYALGLDAKDKAGNQDVNNVFTVLGGDPQKPDSLVPAQQVLDMLAEFGLGHIGLAETFGVSDGQTLNRNDIKSILGV